MHHVGEHRHCGVELLLRLPAEAAQPRELVEGDRLLAILLGARDRVDE